MTRRIKLEHGCHRKIYKVPDNMYISKSHGTYQLNYLKIGLNNTRLGWKLHR